MPDARERLEALRRRRDEARKRAAARRAKLREAERSRRKALDRRIRRAEARVAAQVRREDTRRKILAGAWVLAEADKSDAASAKLRRGLAGFLDRDRDRALFEELFGAGWAAPPPEGGSRA